MIPHRSTFKTRKLAIVFLENRGWKFFKQVGDEYWMYHPNEQTKRAVYRLNQSYRIKTV